MKRAAPFQHVLDFWFGPLHSAEYGHPRKEWFRKDEAFDAQIRAQFLPTWEAGSRGELDDWREQPPGAVALCVVLDQFPRNIFRGEARAFSTDFLALICAQYALTHAFDKRVLPVQQVFLYLPLGHHENLASQERAVALFEKLAESNPELADNADYARRRWQIIARFGRFPHRNAALGRTSTPEEIEFLRQPGSGF